MDIQSFVDGFSAGMRLQRAKTQMTLGRLVEELAALPLGTPVRGIGEPCSYRGYYTDLAFEPGGRDEPVEAVLARVRDCMGRTFIGWKGGEFVMAEDTPVWSAGPGEAFRPRIMGLHWVDGVVCPVLEDEPD